MSGTPDSLAGDNLAVLDTLDRDTLTAAWRRTFKTPTPKGISRRLMVQILTYEAQVQQRGGLKPAVRRRLARWATGRAQAPSPRLRPGARLVREWNGVSHVVDVTEAGVVCLEGLAEPGGIVISGTASDHFKNKLALGFEFQSKQRVKNVAEPVRVYRIALSGPRSRRLRLGRFKRPSWVWTAAAGAVLIAAGEFALWQSPAAWSGATTATTYEVRVGTSIWDSALRTSNSVIARGRLGAKGTSASPPARRRPGTPPGGRPQIHSRGFCSRLARPRRAHPPGP